MVREEAASAGRSTAHRHAGPLQRYINDRVDIALNMLCRRIDNAPVRTADPLEETPEKEVLELEEERRALGWQAPDAE